jgi:hypothetical protein
MTQKPKMSPFACSLLYSTLALLIAAALPVWSLIIAGRKGFRYVEATGFLWEAIEQSARLLKPPGGSFALFWDQEMGNIIRLVPHR